MSCSYCFGTGNVMARLKESDIHIPFSFVCSCSKARRRSFPAWSRDRLADYEVLEQQTPEINPIPRKPIKLVPLKEMPK